MKFLLQILLFASLCFIPSFVSAQSILVDDNQTAQQLIENVLVRSSCFTISNATVTGDSYTTGKNSYGYFSNQGGSFPFSEGIILSTWSATNSKNGPSAIDKATIGDSRWLGDPDLESASGIAPELTKNATVLEFDFIPKTNFISFNYLFASNEYRDYFPCEFTDSFAFLIKEKASTNPYKNIALLPNSAIPVASTNIHPLINDYLRSDGVKIKGCPPINENYFGGYNISSSPINYYGQTKVLNAQIVVTAGVTYHIKLVIADYRNEEFDSAVFLEAGSFAPKINLGPDQTICFNENTVLDSGLRDSNYSYEWFKDGNTTPLSGEDKSTLKVTTAGIYSVEVTLAPNCIAKGKVTVNYKSKITKAITQCGDEFGSGIFDLATIKSSLNLKSTDVVNFFSDLAETEITNTSNYFSTPKTVYAKVANSTGECLNFIELELKVLSTLNALQTRSFCDNDGMQDGIRLFDLKNEIDPLIQVVVGINYLVEGYYSSSSDAATKQLKLVNSYTSKPNEIIYARVENGNDCYGIYPIELNFVQYRSANPDIIKNIAINNFAGSNNSVEIDTNGSGPFEYSLDGIIFQSIAIFKNITAGTYTIFVRDKTNCTLSSAIINVLDYPRYFTPNADGINDVWTIKNLVLFPKAVVNIFDRYGKLIYQLSAVSNEWNGNFDNKPLPADDYWFHIKFTDSKTIKGHFSLKR